MIQKTLSQEFDKFKDLLIREIPFVFTRFSDGELCILKNEELKLAEDHLIISGERHNSASYAEEDRKHYIPERDHHVHNMLMSAFIYNYPNYLVGIGSPAEWRRENYEFMINLLKNTDSDNITFANLLVNKNYHRFMSEIIYGYLTNHRRDVILIANNKSKLDSLPFKISHFIGVGYNCFINDLDKIESVYNLLRDDNSQIVLSSASSLSALIFHRCFTEKPNCTYINIGTTLNPIMGFSMNRSYMETYWKQPRHWGYTAIELSSREEIIEL